MILPDVNVLVFAFRKEAQNHKRYREWLQSIVDGADELALHDISLLGFVRVVTNSRIFENPDTTPIAMGFVTALMSGARVRWLLSGEEHWTAFSALSAKDRQISGRLVPDALLAALAITHGCRLATADRGFARFPGLDWFDPAA